MTNVMLNINYINQDKYKLLKHNSVDENAVPNSVQKKILLKFDLKIMQIQLMFCFKV